MSGGCECPHDERTHGQNATMIQTSRAFVNDAEALVSLQCRNCHSAYLRMAQGCCDTQCEMRRAAPAAQAISLQFRKHPEAAGNAGREGHALCFCVALAMCGRDGGRLPISSRACALARIGVCSADLAVRHSGVCRRRRSHCRACPLARSRRRSPGASPTGTERLDACLPLLDCAGAHPGSCY
jgi:hypothetical protein